ncbi:iripin-3-like [Brevipalpus obovatus]|uniref:iripin-3-like n=1 Tax=Brevipalpus obovatus TaxID=246614 RepID=UPI003D9FA7D4
MGKLESYWKSFLIIEIIFVDIVIMNESPSENEMNSELSMLRKSSNEFGLSMIKRIHSTSENIIFSPLGVLMAYSMLIKGAKGKTKDEIIKTFTLDAQFSEQQEIFPEFKKLLRILNRNSEHSSLSMSNLLAISNRFNVSEAFRHNAVDNFDALIAEEDFTNGETVMNQMNTWISEKTHHAIKDFLTTPLDPKTLLFLINICYFKGKWIQAFDKRNTKESIFHNADTSSSSVEMMRNSKIKLLYHADESTQVIELPYHGNFSMIIFLPQENHSVMDIVNNLSEEKFEKSIHSMTRENVESLMIPKFKLDNTHHLDRLLPPMGITTVFTEFADLSDMSGQQTRVSQSVQKAQIMVNEEGTEVAVVSSIAIETRSFEVGEEFIADRPFFFVIQDQLTGINILQGIINKLGNSTAS